jgi:hypothetical protein
MERNHRRILHRWLASSTRRLQVDAQRRDIVCDPIGGYRGCIDWLQQDDGGQHEAGRSTATTERRRRTIWGRWHGGCCVGDFGPQFCVFGEGDMMQKDGQLNVWTSGVIGMIWHIPQAFSAAGGVHTLLICVLSCIIHTTRHVPSGGVSRRTMSPGQL